MSGLFKTPKTPKIEPVAPTPQREDMAIQDAANMNDKLRQRRGRSSTLLSGVGDAAVAGSDAARGKTLLGG